MGNINIELRVRKFFMEVSLVKLNYIGKRNLLERSVFL